MQCVDLNCDMGESTHLHSYNIENDLALLQYVSSVNLACGFHAGDAHTMHHLVESALIHGIAIGAHAGLPDRENFGRTDMRLSPEMIYDIVLYQLGSLHAFLKVHQSKLHHVKPHGALYNLAAKEKSVADAICNAVKDFDDSIMLYGLSGSEMIITAQQHGLRSAGEAFGDRTYQEDGSLTPRTLTNALIENEQFALEQVLQIVQHQRVTSTGGKAVFLKAETICIHSDGSYALKIAQKINEILSLHHVCIRQP